ncbi:acyltransferase family protein [Colwellia sp. TT2012]|uniref:acyltransferase family protein n=1 Tax=Colwellia sp. TT2012 TaxID=1720342 RepID=UPI00071117EA|nr:acyltransferase family protein [Colwellia sp. TT2012]
MKKVFTNRITWLDSCRGLAIMLLIAVHYVGALESRELITKDILVLIKSILRVATPYFILMFGFTFAIAYGKKIQSLHDVKSLYFNLMPRLGLVLLGREVIVLATAVRYPEMQEYLLSTLFYQSFSRSGEILSFYFFAIACAPLVLYWLQSMKKVISLFVIIITYSVSYYIGSHYATEFPTMWFRFLFYNVYPFFPFFSLVMLGMLLARLYKQISTDKLRMLLFGCMSLIFIVLGSVILQYVSKTPLLSLANAELKAPPHPSYVLIYTGIAIFISSVLALLSTKKWAPQIIFSFLDVIGRNSLLAYVLHYFLFIATPISQLVFTTKSTINELSIFVVILLTMFGLIYYRDSQKIAASTKKMVIK